MKNFKIIIANDMVSTYVSAHNTVDSLNKKMAELKAKMVEANEEAYYIYKGKEKITNCVTVSKVNRTKTIVTNQEAYDALQVQIDALKALQEQYTEIVDNSYYKAVVTAMPKTLNKMLENGEI